MANLDKELSDLTIGTPQHFAHLTLFPLLHPTPSLPFYLTLDEALALGTIQVTEVGAGGHVPEVRLINRGDRPVLLLDGEELVGAKQNRVLNLTVLAPAHCELVIPVSCVEQGRWHHVAPAFVSSPRVQFASGRAAKAQTVSAALAMERGAVSDQSQVWHEIEGKRRRMGIRSETGAMADLFDGKGTEVEGYVAAFAAQERQTGAIFALGGRVAGLELFDSPETLRRLLPKLVRSYTLDAIECPGTDSPVPPLDAAAALLHQVATATVQRFPGIGLGETLRLQAPGLTGAGLSVDEGLVHLAAFRTTRDGGAWPPSGSRIHRASRRFQV